MSKKLAAGNDAIVLDVKCGKGAFMKTVEDARALSELMVEIGDYAGKKTVAVISDMNRPLGYAVGNSLEVREAIEVLKGKGPDDIRELSIKLAGIMAYLGGKSASEEEGCNLAESALNSGQALDKFREFIKAQGGNQDVCDDFELLPLGNKKAEVYARKKGYVWEIDGERIGFASQHTGAGRKTKEDSVDFGAGILLNKKIGDAVCKGDLIATAFGNDDNKVKSAGNEVLKAYSICDKKPEKTELIKEII